MVLSLFFSIIFIAFLILYIVTYAKRSVKLQRFFLALIIPSLIGISLPLLFLKSPDSNHITFIAESALIFAGLHILIKIINFSHKELFDNFCLILSLFLWTFGFYSIFLIYKVPAILHLIFLCAYIILFVFTIFRFSLHTFKELFLFFIPEFLSACFCYISIITIINVKSLSSIFFLISSFSFIVYTSLTFSTRFKASIKHQSLILNLLFMTGQIMAITGTILLQYKIN